MLRVSIFRSACLISLVAPIVALVFYPRLNWLFAFVLVAPALFIFGILTHKSAGPEEVVSRAERILSGAYGTWDVDDYENLNPKEASVNELWRKTMAIGGLPEEWAALDETKKKELNEVIQKMKRLSIPSVHS